MRLNSTNLALLPDSVVRPRYDRGSAGCGIVHLGIGAFHRAHQAVFTDEAMNRSGGDWCITGVSMRSDSVARELRPQDCLYSVLSEDRQYRELRVIGAVKQVLVAPRERQAVLDVLAAATTHIVTLTITEKGYCQQAGGGGLDLAHPDIAADITDPRQPRSAIGLLALALALRAAGDAGPLTVISCDNLAENGRVLQNALSGYLAAAFPEARPWVAANVAFPCSMVDRIVPAATPAQRARQSELLGCKDTGGITTEPFSQWIIEDRFTTERPDWVAAGVQLVEDIRPYEELKLRLLNASHSAIAYSGLLTGHDTVDQVVADPALGSFVCRLMDEDLIPSLEVPVDFNLPAYRDALVTRFTNPCLGHRCSQIAMDGSEKIRQRWLPTLQLGRCPLLLQALAVWCRFVLATDLALEDPRSEQLLALRNGPPEAGLSAALACAGITRDTVPDYDQLYPTVVQNLDCIAREGVLGLLAG